MHNSFIDSAFQQKTRRFCTLIFCVETGRDSIKSLAWFWLVDDVLKWPTQCVIVVSQFLNFCLFIFWSFFSLEPRLSKNEIMLDRINHYSIQRNWILTEQNEKQHGGDKFVFEPVINCCVLRITQKVNRLNCYISLWHIFMSIS